MAQMKNLRDLLTHEIKDLYSAEKQLIESLPKMAENARDEELQHAFREHLEETKNHKLRLEQVASHLDIDVNGDFCEAMQGLIKEGENMIHEDADQRVKDAGLISTAQRVEHYEISAYGSAHYFAEELGLGEVANLLKQTLQEEKSADTKLNDIAKNRVNRKAEV